MCAMKPPGSAVYLEHFRTKVRDFIPSCPKIVSARGKKTMVRFIKVFVVLQRFRAFQRRPSSVIFFVDVRLRKRVAENNVDEGEVHAHHEADIWSFSIETWLFGIWAKTILR